MVFIRLLLAETFSHPDVLFPITSCFFLEERDGEEINTDREKDNPGLNSYTSTSSDMPSPPILLNKKKLLKREKSRVQFFIENDPPTANRPNDRQRLEDSPTESWKSEYSGTDLRQLKLHSLEIVFC